MAQHNVLSGNMR